MLIAIKKGNFLFPLIEVADKAAADLWLLEEAGCKSFQEGLELVARNIEDDFQLFQTQKEMMQVNLKLCGH